MVTQAAKDLLKNTIQSVGFHNRVLEEQEMWKQWELEQGLTMMVSDDHIRRRIAERATATSKASRSGKRKKDTYKERSPKSSANNNRNQSTSTDRWGHDGFYELEYGSATHQQKRSDGDKKQRSLSCSSESCQSNSQPLLYGPRPPLSSNTQSKRSAQKHRKRGKKLSPASSSSVSSISTSSDSTSSYPSDIEEKSSLSSSSNNESRCPKRRRYRKLQRERKGRSPTRRITTNQEATYGQCLKLRQIYRKAAAKRRHQRRKTYSSSSESESQDRSSKQDSSSEESGDESSTSSSSGESSDQSSKRVRSRESRRRHRSFNESQQRSRIIERK